MRLPLRRKLFLSHFLAIVLVSGSIGTLVYRAATQSLLRSLQERLEYSAALLSRTIDAAALDSIRTAADVALPAYQDNLQKLRDFQTANRDIAFIYLMRLDGEQVRFVIDSDASPDQATPGQPYEPAVPTLLAGFHRISADEEITGDRWGYFLSGYAPLRGGGGQYLIGIDMRADDVHRQFLAIRLAGVGSLLLSMALAWWFSRYLASRMTRPILALATRADEIAHGKLEGEVAIATGDELETLGRAFNAMTSGLAAGARQNRESVLALEEARATLEQRVEERTSRLVELNQSLLAEIGERRRAEEALEKAATTDYLTGLLNRRAMVQLLTIERERMRRRTAPFSIALIDVDHFKQINDQHGHEVGDQTLIFLANELRQLVRAQDAISRWGGEELLIFLPETPAAGAGLVAEKVRARFASAKMVVAGHEIALTMSVGVASQAADQAIDETIGRADAALYRAKLSGRNLVVNAD